MLKNSLKLIMLAAFLGFANLSQADVCNPADPDYDPVQCDAFGPGSGAPGAPVSGTSAVPVDGGASLLAVAGIGYGIRRVRSLRKKSGEENTEN
jgi:hypothetical protein